MIANSLQDTITAVSTPRGTGAIAVIRMSGRASFAIAAKVFSGTRDFYAIDPRMAVHGHIAKEGGVNEEDRRIIDEVILTKFKSPNSYTGEDVVEISCHGSRYIVHEILGLLTATGARIRLLPGDPFTALSRAANSLGGTDLLVVSSRVDPDALARAWFYVPRMLGEESLVLIEEAREPGSPLAVRPISGEEIAQRAAGARRRRAA